MEDWQKIALPIVLLLLLSNVIWLPLLKRRIERAGENALLTKTAGAVSPHTAEYAKAIELDADEATVADIISTVEKKARAKREDVRRWKAESFDEPVPIIAELSQTATGMRFSVTQRIQVRGVDAWAGGWTNLRNAVAKEAAKRGVVTRVVEAQAV